MSAQDEKQHLKHPFTVSRQQPASGQTLIHLRRNNSSLQQTRMKASPVTWVYSSPENLLSARHQKCILILLWSGVTHPSSPFVWWWLCSWNKQRFSEQSASCSRCTKKYSSLVWRLERHRQKQQAVHNVLYVLTDVGSKPKSRFIFCFGFKKKKKSWSEVTEHIKQENKRFLIISSKWSKNKWDLWWIQGWSSLTDTLLNKIPIL